PDTRHVRDNDQEEYWLQEAIALTTSHKLDDKLKIDEYFESSSGNNRVFELRHGLPNEVVRVLNRFQASYRYDTGPMFHLLDSDLKVEMCSLNNIFKLGHRRYGELYLPVHKSCLQMADRFVQNALVAATLPSNSITSQLMLWEVLHRRVDPFCLTATYPKEPNKFFADSWTARQCPLDLENSEEIAIYEVITANPLDIPDLTESILSNLQPIKQPLNNELQSDMQSQDLWCDALAQTDRLPWLWDLNVEMIRSRQRMGQWDWKELVTKLRRSDIHRPVDVSLQLPLSLRNRRRIWRILEVARVNDVADIATKARMTGPTAWMYGGVTSPPSAHPLYGYEILPLPTQPLPPHSASGFPPPSGSLLRPQSAINDPPTSYYQEAMKNRPPGFMEPPPSHAEYLKNRPLGFPEPPLFYRKITKLPELVSSGLLVSSSITSEANLEPSESSTRGTTGPLLKGTEQQFPSQEKLE
ncbi:hypothetical protein D6D29_10434, partial [Aureobasidium pullulans]